MSDEQENPTLKHLRKLKRKVECEKKADELIERVNANLEAQKQRKEQAKKDKVESEEEAIRNKKLQVLAEIQETLQRDKQEKVNAEVLKVANYYFYAMSFLAKGIIDHFTISINTVKIDGDKITYEREFHFFKDGREILIDGLTPILSTDSKEDEEK